MSLLRIVKNTREAPPGPDNRGYQFTHETGHKSYGLDPDTWWADILKFRRNNGLPILDDLRATVEDQFCHLLPPGWCQYEDGSAQTKFIQTRLTIDDIWHGTLVLVAFVDNGCQITPKEVAESRARICAACEFNVGVSGCGPCVGLSALVGQVAKGATSSDEQLGVRVCAICKCSSRAQVWLPADVLAAGVDDEMLTRFPSHCWKKSQISELRN